MPRKTRKITVSDDTIHVTVMMPVADVTAIDAEARRLSKEDEFGRSLTRSDVVRLAVHKFLAKET